ncbi:unnamed protein product [Mycena citricolor]|uniref:Uncharacterized protein n=1 Tax=Mycena citricolor TaxID=2018698 RepID=A0AAD2K581_9AGAR|nr:unnamed protein product [Mycena citricolor]
MHVVERLLHLAKTSRTNILLLSVVHAGPGPHAFSFLPRPLDTGRGSCSSRVLSCYNRTALPLDEITRLASSFIILRAAACQATEDKCLIERAVFCQSALVGARRQRILQASYSSSVKQLAAANYHNLWAFVHPGRGSMNRELKKSIVGRHSTQLFRDLRREILR